MNLGIAKARRKMDYNGERGLRSLMLRYGRDYMLCFNYSKDARLGRSFVIVSRYEYGDILFDRYRSDTFNFFFIRPLPALEQILDLIF